MDNLKKKSVLKKEKINLNMPMNLFTTWDQVILQHVFISLLQKNNIFRAHIFYNIFSYMDQDYESKLTVMQRISSMIGHLVTIQQYQFLLNRTKFTFLQINIPLYLLGALVIQLRIEYILDKINANKIKYKQINGIPKSIIVTICAFLS